ncbi:MAG: hypothetical protein BEN19_00345 [Epulopiscium sp. Nuni2H_MBin003]|nr:MAG: hypothetical protein BEN19_00345 [Epulopiscium sp. Nuni2H_MBin003]
MAGIKSLFLKKLLNFSISEDSDGFLKLHAKSLAKLEDDNEVYADKIISLLQLIKGIQTINLDKKNCFIDIKYDSNVISVQNIIKYIDVIIDVISDNLSLISNSNTAEVDTLLGTLNDDLQQRAKKIGI